MLLAGSQPITAYSGDFWQVIANYDDGFFIAVALVLFSLGVLTVGVFK